MINHTFFKPEDIVELIAKAYYNAALSPDISMQEMTDLLEQLRGDYKTRSYYDIWVRWQYPKEDGFKPSVLKVLVSLKQESGECFKKRLCEHLQAVLKENPESFYTDFMPQYVEAINNWFIDIADALCENCGKYIPPQLGKRIEQYRNVHQLIAQSRWAETYNFYATLSVEDHLTNEQKAKLEATAGQIRLYYLDTTPERALVHFEKAKALSPDLARIDRSFGEEKLRGRRFDEARRFFFRALDKKGDDVETQFYIGDSYKDEKNYSAAENWYREGLKNNPFNADFNTRMIRLNSEPDLFHQKFELYEKELAIVKILEPDYPFNNTIYNTYREIAAGYQLNMQYEKAIEWYKKAIDLNEKWIMAWLDLGYTYSMIPNYAEAEIAYQKVIDLAPDCFDGYWAMALLHDNRANYDKAISYYEICLKLRPEWMENISNTLGVLYYNANYNEKALEYYLKAIEMNPNNALYHENIGYYYSSLGKYEEAIPHLENAINLEPDNSARYRKLGTVYRHLKNFDKARYYFEKAIDLNPQDADAINDLGVLYFDHQIDDNKAIEYYEKAISINSSIWIYYENLGLAYEIKNETEKAKAAYEKAIELNPDDVKMLLRIIGFYRKIGDDNRLKGLYENVIQLDPNNADCYNNLGVIHYNKNTPEDDIKAQEYYEKAIQCNPAASIYHENLGWLMYNLKDYEKAYASYQKAYDINPNNALTSYRLGLSYVLTGQNTEGVTYLKKAVELEPTNAIYFEDLGTAYFMNKEWHNAAEAFKKTLELNPEHTTIFNRFLECIDNLDNKEEAKALLQSFKTTNAEYQNIIKQYLKKGDN